MFLVRVVCRVLVILVAILLNSFLMLMKLWVATTGFLIRVFERRPMIVTVDMNFLLFRTWWLLSLVLFMVLIAELLMKTQLYLRCLMIPVWLPCRLIMVLLLMMTAPVCGMFAWMVRLVPVIKRCILLRMGTMPCGRMRPQ